MSSLHQYQCKLVAFTDRAFIVFLFTMPAVVVFILNTGDVIAFEAESSIALTVASVPGKLAANVTVVG